MLSAMTWRRTLSTLPLLLLLLLQAGRAAALEETSFVAGGGILARGAQAMVLTLDAELLLPPLMLGYRYGILEDWEVGAEIGGDKGLFQALLTAKRRLVERQGGYWGLRTRAGYKTHDWSAGEIVFDDRSVVVSLEHVAALRLGRARTMALYVNTFVYFDIDLRTPRRQTDIYLSPASVGFEALLGRRVSLFIEVGFGIGLNGTETNRGLLYVSDIFPIGELGLALLL